MMVASLHNPDRMIVSRIDYLRRAKALAEGRDISLRTVAREAGVSVNAVQRLRGAYPGGVTLATVDLLCRYFDVKTVADLIEYQPNEWIPPSEQ
jgi:DNA-binding Xre family transcriptional regulator